ncbi:MAG: ATP-binding protein [Acidisphaera sp.]|nr:ATP-binding protein [Acidisphaera sp.]MBV9811956.1 ATP-binding protein [Acetobacteraceae bacterium]
MTQAITRLRVDDEAFLVSSLIERCPKVMMLRELVQNALEAAQLAPDGARRVEILPVLVGSARKLAIRNTGPGMSAEQLFRMCDLAASIGKAKSLDGNFGMGAKVASLPANPLGLRYRSCHAGRVHEVVIGKRDGVYGRVRRTDPLTSRGVDVLDATGAARADGLSLAADWTEVVLLGAHAEQDTVADPFDGTPAMPADWIAAGLYGRFYRLPLGVALLLHEGTHRLAGTQPFAPLAARGAAFARYEPVAVADGILLHYTFDPADPERGGRNRSERGALQDAGGFAALAFRDELYDRRDGWMWAHAGPRFGIAFGAQHFSVVVELPHDAPVLADGYRQFLRYADGEQRHVEVTDFAALVAAHRPAWLLDQLRALGPDARVADTVREELASLFRGLGVRRVSRAPATPPTEAAAVARKAPDDTLPPEASQAVEESEVAPEVVLLRDARHVHDRLLDGRAANYDAASHALFVNLRYPAFAAMRETLITEHAGYPDHARLGAAAQDAVEHTAVRRIGRALVHGIAKRETSPGWNTWQLQAAVSPEALTLAADDYLWSLPEARGHLARALAS